MIIFPNMTNIASRVMLMTAVVIGASACTYQGKKLWAVDATDVDRGDVRGASFKVRGDGGYDRVWAAAMAAMSKDMTILESHKPSGSIKSRQGAGKVVGFWITPTLPNAPEYRIETSMRKAIGVNSLNDGGWDSAVVDNFMAALGAKAAGTR
jgi:hypothetical protein